MWVCPLCGTYVCGYVPYVVPMYVGMCGVCVYGIMGILSTGITCAIIMSACNFVACPCSLFPCILTLQ